MLKFYHNILDLWAHKQKMFLHSKDIYFQSACYFMAVT